MIPPLNTVLIDGIPLDEGNVEFKKALGLILKEGKNVFLTGKAGTGKTTFLKALKQISERTMVVTAPTGVAAVNAGGMTLHSMFYLKLQPM